MSQFDQFRWLQAVVLVASLATGHPTAFSQPSTQTPAPTPAPAANPPAVSPSQAVTVPAFKPTPEQIGDTLFARQRYQEAIAAYKQAPADSAEVWNKMGIAYQMMFNLVDASRCYRNSLRINPKNSHVLNNLGTVYDSLKEYSEAERMYRKAVKVDPASALIYKNLGTSLLSQHKYKKGWEIYKTALTIDPHIFENTDSPRVDNPASVEDRGAMNYYMARGCVRAGMNDCAIEYLRMALNEGFTNPKKLESDSEFAGLRGFPAFERLLAAQRAQ
jgi:Flp pilus assembly protein TadD